jgi:hypothetical protein
VLTSAEAEPCGRQNLMPVANIVAGKMRIEGHATEARCIAAVPGSFRIVFFLAIECAAVADVCQQG